MKKWLVCIMLSSPWGYASTFVGNGGGAGDVELATTRRQIEETFTVVKKRGEDPEIEFCRCTGMYDSRSVCNPLKVLSEPQKKFCSQALVKQAPEILKLVQNPHAVSIRWTDQTILVNDRGYTRAVDAVTDRKKREITIHLKNFRKLQQFERVYLLTHEYLHLTEYAGKPMEDEGTVGPFVGDQGGRQLLDAMGSAAAVMQSQYPFDIKRYRARLMRSQSWKPFWFELNGGTARFQEQPKGTWASEDYSRWQGTFKYALGNFVLLASIRNEKNNKKALDTVEVEENKQISSAGLGYRIFPWSDPETFWGQSHFQLSGMVDFVQAKLRLVDQITIEDKTSTTGGSAALHFYVPVFWGFWGFVGHSYEYHPYKYDNVNLKYKDGLFSHYLGVAYAF